MSINNDINRDLILKLLKLSKTSKKKCRFLLDKHENSLDTYIYQFDGLKFPQSFAYYLLSAIADVSLPFYGDSKKADFNIDGVSVDVKVGGSERLHKFKHYKMIDHVGKRNVFFKLLDECKNLDIKEKLIIPSVEYHCMLLLKLSNSYNIHDEDIFLEEYANEAAPSSHEVLEEYLNLELDEDQKNIVNLNNKTIEQRIEKAFSQINSIKNFFPIIESLRKKHMPYFTAPHETFQLPVLNSNEKILFSKSFVKRNLNLKKYNDLVLMNVGEDNMKGTINKGDLALIIKLKNKVKPKLNNGIYAVNLNDKIVIRRLYFSEFSKRTLVHVISDNKIYGGEQVLLENVKIFGEVVWKCNNFQDIQFLKHEGNEPNLFSNEDIEIPEFVKSKKIDKEIA